MASEGDDLDLESYVDRPEASLEEIRAKMEQTMLKVRVKDNIWRGTLLGPNGYHLVDSGLLVDAFQRETRTVNNNRTIEEQTSFIVPYAFRPGEEELQCSQVETGDLVNLTLMAADFKERPDVDIDYRHNFQVGERVWITKFVGNKIYPEETTIENLIEINAEEAVNAWTIQADLGRVHSGSPVFDSTGALKGVFMYLDGQSLVMPMVTIRERAPLIYKEIK